MLKPVINKYNNTVHSTIEMKPIEAHRDGNRTDVRNNLELKAKYKRTYPNISVNDTVKIYKKGKGNYTSRKETISKWSKENYKVVKIGYDITANKYYQLEGLNKRYLRHEILLID